MSEQPAAFDLITGTRFVRAVKYFLTSAVRWKARERARFLLLCTNSRIQIKKTRSR